MAVSTLRPAKVLLVVIVLVALAVLSNSYSSLLAPQQLAAIYLIKVILAALTVAFLFAFQIRWVMTKYDLSVLDFYTKWKFFKQSIAVGAGIFLLSAAFLLEFWQYAGWLPGSNYLLAVNLLEVLALIFFGYSYYRLARMQGV
jgi:hypothetical protein